MTSCNVRAKIVISLLIKIRCIHLYIYNGEKRENERYKLMIKIECIHFYERAAVNHNGVPSYTRSRAD